MYRKVTVKAKMVMVIRSRAVWIMVLEGWRLVGHCQIRGVVGLQGGGVTLEMEPRNGLERVPGARMDHPLPLKVSN